MSNAALTVSVLFAATLAASSAARRVVWLVLRNVAGGLVVLVAYAVERRRRPAVRSLPSGHAWRCTVYLAYGGKVRPLSSAVITGPWVTSAEVEREAMARWVAAVGWPSAGTLCARAEPVAVSIR